MDPNAPRTLKFAGPEIDGLFYGEGQDPAVLLRHLKTGTDIGVEVLHEGVELGGLDLQVDHQGDRAFLIDPWHRLSGRGRDAQ